MIYNFTDLEGILFKKNIQTNKNIIHTFISEQCKAYKIIKSKKENNTKTLIIFKRFNQHKQNNNLKPEAGI